MGNDSKLTSLEFRKLSLKKVSQLPSGSGNEICSAVYNTLNDWCLLDQVEVFEFDTTESNSGRLNITCLLLKQ
jgi:hypothetical protein